MLLENISREGFYMQGHCVHLAWDDPPSVGGVEHIKQLPLIEAPLNNWSEFSVWTPLIISLEM